MNNEEQWKVEGQACINTIGLMMGGKDVLTQEAALFQIFGYGFRHMQIGHWIKDIAIQLRVEKKRLTDYRLTKLEQIGANTIGMVISHHGEQYAADAVAGMLAGATKTNLDKHSAEWIEFVTEILKRVTAMYSDEPQDS